MKSNDTKKMPVKRRGHQQKEPDAVSAEQMRPRVLADFMNTDELAADLDVTPLTLVRWRLQKTGPAVTRLGRRILYRRSSVQAWLAAQEQKWA
jgi:hypothetical protein